MPTRNKEYPILVVDDDPVVLDLMVRAFSNRGFPVYQAADYEQAVEVLAARTLKLGLFDLRMPGRSGLDLVAAAKKMQPAIRIVVLTGYGSIATATQAIKLGAHNYLSKPADVDEILKAFFIEDDEEELLHPAVAPEIMPASLARVEWEHIQRVLTDCDGNITEAALRLNIHRRSLQRKLANPPQD